VGFFAALGPEVVNSGGVAPMSTLSHSEMSGDADSTDARSFCRNGKGITFRVDVEPRGALFSPWADITSLDDIPSTSCFVIGFGNFCYHLNTCSPFLAC
jgi:hypothetical protein